MFWPGRTLSFGVDMCKPADGFISLFSSLFSLDLQHLLRCCSWQQTPSEQRKQAIFLPETSPTWKAWKQQIQTGSIHIVKLFIFEHVKLEYKSLNSMQMNSVYQLPCPKLNNAFMEAENVVVQMTTKLPCKFYNMYYYSTQTQTLTWTTDQLKNWTLR